MSLRRRLNFLERQYEKRYKDNSISVFIPMRENMFDYESEILKDENGNIIYKEIKDQLELLKHAAIQSRLNI